jgi:ubiquinone/menaquinone biosynthesis C-methylase UbiE
MLDNFKRRIRARRIARHYKPYLRDGASVLDIGCNDGKMAMEIGKILRVKLSLAGTDVLKCKPPFEFRQIKHQKLPFKDNEFDFSMLNDVLHHVPKASQAGLIQETLRVSRTALIFEVAKSKSGAIVDIITNKMHDRRVKVPLTIRDARGWTNLFKKMGLKYKFVTVPRSMNQLFLLKNYFFSVQK